MKSKLMGLSVVLAILTMMPLPARALADTPATHGMLLFGGQQNYASHLPMFHAPHDYQVILKISLENITRANAVEAYEDLKAHGHKLFTLEPEAMDLSQVVSGEKTSFEANLYKDHFERGGEVLGRVQVLVEKIVYSMKLDAEHLTVEDKSYLIFGEGGEHYAAHLIKSKPSFDIVMKVRLDTITQDALPKTVKYELQGKLPKASEFLGSRCGERVFIEKVIYVEEDELAR